MTPGEFPEAASDDAAEWFLTPLTDEQDDADNILAGIGFASDIAGDIAGTTSDPADSHEHSEPVEPAPVAEQGEPVGEPEPAAQRAVPDIPAETVAENSVPELVEPALVEPAPVEPEPVESEPVEPEPAGSAPAELAPADDAAETGVEKAAEVPTVEQSDGSAGNSRTDSTARLAEGTVTKPAKPARRPFRERFHAFVHTPWGVGLRRLLRPGPCTVVWHKIVAETIHVMVFLVMTIMAVWMLQTSLYPDQRFVFDSWNNSGWAFVSSMWDPSVLRDGRGEGVLTAFAAGIPRLNFVILAFIYATLIVATNRFWIATWLFLTVMTVYMVADYIKVEQRLEPVIPADLTSSGGNAGGLTEFIPEEDMPLVQGALVVLAVSFLLMVFLNHFDCRRSLVAPLTHRRIAAGVRCGVLCVMLAFGGVFVHDMARSGTWAYRMTEQSGYNHVWWGTLTDSMYNGTLVSFMELANATPMEEPAGYSQETMEQIARKYADEADSINATRTTDMTDSTVILILSETFTDPTQVPGVKVNEDPLPFIHSLERTTTSGKVLSSGYGGGTANMEYMSLTGMSLTNFSPTLTTPYQQLVPTEKWVTSFNQPWGVENSLGMHPFTTDLYSRNKVYNRFGFRSLRSLDNEDDVFWPQNHIDLSPYISDESAYTGVINELNVHPDAEFISLMTMQNHMPYQPWYGGNQFQLTDTTGKPYPDTDEQARTYTKGVSLTDEATRDFLNKLDEMDRPITVIFYGDHYPSVFEASAADPDNLVAMHETPYFIWSNAASASAGTRLSATRNAYTSPNYFMAQAAEHMDARVSPWLAFLTEMHTQIPAMAVGVSSLSGQGNSVNADGSGIYYMDSAGRRIETDALTDEQRAMIDEYRLIQYDVTCGKNYLKDLGFMDLPE